VPFPLAQARRLPVWLWGALACWCCVQAHAQQPIRPTAQPRLSASAPQALAEPAGTCPPAFAAQPPNSSAGLQASLAQALSLTAACEQRADYHAHTGSLYLLLGQTAAAATALEKALLLQPDLPGAQLDYAQALAQLGETDTAQQLVRQVTARPDIDPGLRQWLQGAAPDNPAQSGGWAWSQLLQTTVGHETNLASATHVNAVTLYLSNGPVLVPLDDSVRPVSGAALKNLLAVQGQHGEGPTMVRVGAALQTRHTAAPTVPDHHMLELSAAYLRALGPGTAQLRWQAHQYRQTDRFAYQDQVLQLHYEVAIPPQPCKWGLSLGQIQQQYPGSPNLDGRYNHARLEGTCQHGPQIETHWGLGGGQDRAQSPLRPGGHKTRQDWSLRHERPVGQATAQAWLRHTYTQDSQPYSPLLGQHLGRTHRIDLGTGLWWPLGGAWSAGFDVESTSQKSSNTLLNIKNLSAYAGVRWSKK
jgi:tetratricopeptide (TPR) repeat protein